MANLTTSTIKAAIRAGTPKHLGDGGGLYLKQRASGPSWFLRKQVRGRTQELAIGHWPETSLAEARDNAREFGKLLKLGQDPRKAGATAQVPTFAELSYLVWDIKKPGWQNGKHVQQWINTLEQHAFPKLGKLPVDAISSSDILSVLQPIWFEMAETAGRLRQRIAAVMEYALATDLIELDPMAKVNAALPKRKRKRKKMRAFENPADLRDALVVVETARASPALKLLTRFSALTGVRPGEARHATWAEIDFAGKNWNIPADKKKERRAFTVPLSTQAMATLEDVQPFRNNFCDYIFPGRSSGKPFSENTVKNLFQRLELDTTAHGLRTTLRTWAQKSGIRYELGENLLAHKTGDSVSQAYARADLLEERRVVLQLWGDFLCKQNTESEALIS